MILERPKFIIFLLILFFAILHAALNTHYSEYLSLKRYVFWAYPVFLFFMWRDYCDNDRDSKAVYVFEDFLKDVLSMLMVVPAVVFVAFSIYIGLRDVYVFLQSPYLSRYPFFFAIGSFSLISAYLLFVFRLRWRAFYGITEVVVGFLVVMHNAILFYEEGLKSNSFLVAVLTAGIYFMVRGLDNWHQGRVKGVSLVSQVKNEIDNNSGDGFLR